MRDKRQIIRPGSVVTRVALALLLGAHAGAVEIRSYSAERHDRFTGYPSAPAFNDSAYYGSRKFTGVAWIPGEGNSRQFALVSPQHLVFALHYAPGAGTTLRFLNSDGVTVDRTVASVITIPNSSSQPVDLCIVRLSAPLLAADGVSHFPYLNLSSDAAYLNTMLTIFGWEMKAGRGSISSIEDSNISGINQTRVMRFQYSNIAGNQDDARVVGGDSGSPSFATANGNPAIVGIHTAAGEIKTPTGTVLQYLGFDSFVPFYISEIDGVMASDGYRMTPAYPPSVTLSSTSVLASPLRQGYAGSFRIDLQNTGANAAGNVRVTLHFQSGQAPDAVTASGWITEQAGPQDWVLRRANLAASATTEINVSWNEVPATGYLPVEFSRVADGSPSAMQTFGLLPAPTFKVWAAGLDDETQTGDPDGDGVSNILEYAFGGDPESGAMTAEAGGALLPAISYEDGDAVVRFPSRTDAAARGLSYVPEFSEDLETWSSVDVPVFTDGTAPFVPASDDFVRRTISWDATDPRRFFRVRVTLDE